MKDSITSPMSASATDDFHRDAQYLEGAKFGSGLVI